MNKNNAFSFFTVLGLIFITLKLVGQITWSWVWVLAPFWAPVVYGWLFLIIFWLVAVYNMRR